VSAFFLHPEGQLSENTNDCSWPTVYAVVDMSHRLLWRRAEKIFILLIYIEI